MASTSNYLRDGLYNFINTQQIIFVIPKGAVILGHVVRPMHMHWE